MKDFLSSEPLLILADVIVLFLSFDPAIVPSTIDAPEMTVAATAVPLKSTNRHNVETTLA